MSTLGLKKVDSETLLRLRRERERLAAADPSAKGSFADILSVGIGLAMLAGTIETVRLSRLAGARLDRVRRGGIAGDRLSGPRVVESETEYANETDFELENIQRLVERATLRDAAQALAAQEPATAPLLARIPQAAKVAATQMADSALAATEALRDATPVDLRARVTGAILTNQVVTDPRLVEAVKDRKNMMMRMDRAASQAMWAGFHDMIAVTASLPDVRASIPLWQIESLDDARVRGQRWGLYPEPHRHRQMSGYVATIDDLQAKNLIPPNGHNCRCTIRPIAMDEATRRGLMKGDQVDAGVLAAINGGREGLIRSGIYPDRNFRR